MGGELTAIRPFRGLRNRPGLAADAKDLLAGQRELTVEHAATPGGFAGRLAFRGMPARATNPRRLLTWRAGMAASTPEASA
ncbi:hypothetical protein [Methylobacterium durans]|uniref:Uncharacterized protein n=1 Tax=Methylobacterium durans TaxID=2202825 RepID=A0A2U8W925_9HYPH|nr:hypothetical protein [Methylobacterium durans]AWN42519.1 hypothetical protein DK389_20960 [Methylobacterium durans]